MTTLKISTVARLLGVSRSSLLLWHERGLIHLGRSPGGHYFMTDQQFEQLRDMLAGSTQPTTEGGTHEPAA